MIKGTWCSKTLSCLCHPLCATSGRGKRSKGHLCEAVPTPVKRPPPPPHPLWCGSSAVALSTMSSAQAPDEGWWDGRPPPLPTVRSRLADWGAGSPFICKMGTMTITHPRVRPSVRGVSPCVPGAWRGLAVPSSPTPACLGTVAVAEDTASGDRQTDVDRSPTRAVPQRGLGPT